MSVLTDVEDRTTIAEFHPRNGQFGMVEQQMVPGPVAVLKVRSRDDDRKYRLYLFRAKPVNI